MFRSVKFYDDSLIYFIHDTTLRYKWAYFLRLLRLFSEIVSIIFVIDLGEIVEKTFL